MTITKTSNDNYITLAVAGRLDTITSTQLSAEMDKIFDDGQYNVLLDLSELEYISSAGLRILLVGQKQAASKNKKFELTGVKETVKDVLDMTGFSGILSIK